MPRPADRRRLRHHLLRHRRPLAAGLLGLAVVLGLSSLRPAPRPTTDVVVVRHDLPGGASLTAADLQVEPWDTAHLPGGVLTDPGQAVGHRTAGPVRAGEALTDVRLASSAGLGDPSSPDEVAVPVRLADASLGGLLDPGVLVDVIAADGHGSARVVAEDAEVLSIPGGSSATGDAFEGVLVVLSVPPDTATELAAAAAVGPLSVSLRG